MRVINEDIAGLYLMSWAAIQKETINTINRKARTVHRITELLLDQDINKEEKRPVGIVLSEYLAR